MKRSRVWLALFLAGFALRGSPAPQEGLSGAWGGAITVMGQELRIVVRFDESGGAWRGTIDIPQQMAMGLALSSVRREGDRLHFELAAGPGLAVFDGVLAGESIQGDFMQAGIKGTFSVSRAAAKPREEPQESPKTEALPYREEEVAVASGEITLRGTLTLPAGAGPFPAVIMITGSGTQNRDEEILGFRIFRVIADHLARRGIAVLRCDDRGLGMPGPQSLQPTSEDFAGDVVAQARYLDGRPEIARERIGLFGHSEGGLIAPLAGRSRRFAFMVLMAGTAVRGDAVLLEQIGLIARADGSSAAEVAEALAGQKRVYALMAEPDGGKEIERIVAAEVRRGLEKMPPVQRRAVADPEAYVREITAGQMLALNSPWFRYFLSYDPAPALEAVPCPVLALFGGRDMQVSAAQNMPAMQKAFAKGGNAHVTFKVFPEANHLFQRAKTGSPAEYASLEKAFVPGFLEAVSGWILEANGLRE